MTTAVLDACVLYPATLRDLLVQLAVEGVFEARWTAEIHEEWIGSLMTRRPSLDRSRLERTRGLMNSRVSNSLVTGHMALVASLALPDPGDRHVLAAAIHCGAEVIVTSNLKHFPTSILINHTKRASHPDAFLCALLDENPEGVRAAIRIILRRLKNPPMTAGEYMLSLEQQGLAQLAARLREFADLL